MKSFIRSLLLLSLAALLTTSAIPSTVSAVSASEWKAGRIIDDSVFTNASGMSVGEIQAFLNARVPVCDTWGTQTSEFGGGTRAQYAASRGYSTPFTCLKDYYEVPKTSPGPTQPASNYGGASIPAGAQSAAQIIANAATKYNISPQALLVKLATESPGPLTSDDWPFQKQYLYAMGAHCPDSGPNGSANCDPDWAGFSLQMDEAAALLRWYIDSMTQSWWQYKKPYQVNNILWNVIETGCGGSDVYIENKATAALYTYTPYQPNQAALNNLYGTGDGCSAYGNRNFWRVWSDWFGSTRRDLITTAGHGVYQIENGVKRAFPDEITFLSYRNKWSDVLSISGAEFNSIPAGNAVPYNVHYRNGQLITTDGNSIYLIVNGQKRNVPSESVFLSHGWKWSYLRTVSSQEFNYIPAGEPVPYNVHYRNGQLITTDGNSIYLIVNGQKRNVPSESVFLSHGWKWSYLRTVSSQEFNYIPAGEPVPYNSTD